MKIDKKMIMQIIVFIFVPIAAIGLYYLLKTIFRRIKMQVNNFTPSDEIIDKTKQFEGLRLNVYKDTAGFRTIGYGHNLDAAGDTTTTTITQQQADEYLKNDIEAAAAAVKQFVKVPVNADQFDALVSFAFSTGADYFEKSPLLKNINGGQSAADTAKELLLYDKDHAGNTLESLQRRREYEAKLFTFV